MDVIKRDGSRQEFNVSKIHNAINNACVETGLEVWDGEALVNSIEEILDGHDSTVDHIQTIVENVLMDAQYHDVARAYIQYRHDRDRARVSMPTSAISDYTTVAKYSKFQQSLGRREVYHEIVARSCTMHTRRFPAHTKDIRRAFGAVQNKKILPSMRSMQFGGEAIDVNNVRAFNCSFTHINRLRVFGEIFWVLLSGAGVGYSVQFQHVNQLPPTVPIGTDVRHHRIEDTIEGWADAINELIRCHYVSGELIEFDYSGIRSEGSPLRVSGGKAPGHLPLKKAIELIRSILSNATGRRLRPIEVFDTICHLADAVLAGGIRRSSCICIFSIDDYEMMTSKAMGNYTPEGVPGKRPKNCQRAMANISGFCQRDTTTRDQFDRLISLAKDWGDPGFFWGDDPNFGINPCAEIGMDPVWMPFDGDDTLDYDWEVYRDEYFWKGEELFRRDPITDLTDNQLCPVGVYGSGTGFSFCNLCEINGAVITSVEDFYEAAEAATIIGTLQATLTDMPYLGPVTEAVVKRDALLGVGLTGILDNPEFCLDPDMLEAVALWCLTVNATWAAKLGIASAARVSTVKPGGTGPLVLGCVASGSTPHHAPRYFRRITANPNEHPAQHFKSLNPHMVEVKPNGDWCITFCVTAPDDAVCLPDLKDTDHMDMIYTLYESWVKPGTRHGALTHNVSCTIVVDDWDAAIESAWENRDRVAAMAFLPRMGDKMFPFAPREAVVTAADEAKWIALCENYTEVDWSLFREDEDHTDLSGEVACGGGACEI
ncbi:MAG: recombinase [Robiginitomaculum sp.]|nr:MAG: recombinase [Robiginitomaculum sp.]